MVDGGDREPIVRVRDLRKRYRTHEAVSGVSFSVLSGQVYGLIGPDGAGKSSVLKAVAGVLTFDDGTLEVFGMRVDSDASAERIKDRLGFMPQGLGLNLYPELSIDENVEFFARLRQVPAHVARPWKEELLARTRLAGARDRPVKHLSGGMKQKLALVCTLVHAPRLAVLDEPTTGVDPLSRREFWALLTELVRERGITVLVSTTYMDEASRLERLTFMHAGRALAEGGPDELRRRVKAWRVRAVVEPQVEAIRRLAQRGFAVESEGRALRVLVEEPLAEAAVARVRATLGRGRAADVVLSVRDVTAAEPELEDVFAWLMERERVPARARALGPASPPRDASGDAVAVEAVGLTRDFGTLRAVDGVSFRVTRGEIVGLLGANGAGKTTVIKMLTGLLRPTAGLGRVAGVDMRRPSREIKRRIGYVSQAFSLYQDLTAIENIRLFAGVYGLERARTGERVAWVVEVAGLGGHEHDRAGTLPLGLRQRLALGCALVHRPHVLFLDEPTAGVDPVGRRRFWELLVALAREHGVAALMTTHHMAEAEHCDRVVLMFAGRLVGDGSPADLTESLERERGQPWELAIADPSDALARLHEGGFDDASVVGPHVCVTLRDPARDLSRVEALLVGLGVRRMERRPVTLEEVFVARATELERATNTTRRPA